MASGGARSRCRVRSCIQTALTGRISGSGGPLRRCCRGASLQQRQGGYSAPGSRPRSPPGPSREGQSRDALPPPAPLPIAASWGGSRSTRGPRGARLKGHVQIGDSGDLAQLPGRLRPCAPGLRIRRGAGLPSPGINLAFYLFFPLLVMTFLVSLGGLSLGMPRDHALPRPPAWLLALLRGPPGASASPSG